MNPGELFEASSPLAREVARRGGDPVAAARAALADLSEEEKVATLDAHPRIGAPTAAMSERSRREQGAEAEPAVLADLDRLNSEYEAKFGFRFVVFVAGRSRAEVLEVLRQRLGNSRADEMRAGLEAIIAIAEDRAR